MSFQTQVNLTPAPAVEGDFASTNPRSTVLAGPGGLVTGAAGVTVGKFAWLASDGKTVTNSGEFPATPDGFIANEGQALVTAYLGQSSLVIPGGLPVTVFNGGDFWARNLGPSALSRLSAVYARYSDGALVTAVPSGASVTATLGSTNTASLGATFTAAASVTSTSLVITAVTGYIGIGDTVSGSGISGGQTIFSQASGTTGGAGTYTLSAAATCTGGTVTSFGETVDFTVVSTYLSIGDTVNGTSFPTTPTITGQISGTTGGAGVYTISAPGTAYVASASGVTTYGYTVKVTAVGSGTLAVGEPIADSTHSTAIPATAVIASQLNGTPGGTGVYTLSLLNAIGYYAGDTLTTTAGVLVSQFTAQSAAAVGELVKISSWGA